MKPQPSDPTPPENRSSSKAGRASPWSGALAYWPVLLTLSLGVMLVLSLVNLRQGQLRQAEHARVETELSALRTRLEATVVSTFNPTVGLAAMIQLDGDISPERFQALVSRVLEPVPHVRSVAAAPDDVVRHVYPLKGNESVVQLDYRRIPVQYAQIQQARARGEPLIVAPVKLVQGGTGLIQRSPVFLPAPEGRPRRYWGVVSVVADLPRFVASAGLNQGSLDLALFEAGSPTSLGPLIWGEPSLADSAPVIQHVLLPGARWALAARPRGGWSEASAWLLPEVWGAVIAGLLLSASAGLLSWRRQQLQLRNQQLSHEVAQGLRVQAELEQSRARFRSVAALGSDWVWEQDAELRLSYVSRLAEEATDVMTHTVLGHRRWESPALAPGTDWDAHRALLARRESFKDFEYAQLGSDGSLRHISISGVPLFDADGRFQGYRGTGRNLTESKRAAAALRASEAALTQTSDRLQAVLDAAVEVAIIATDLQGCVILFNHGAELMLGYSEAQMLGQRPVMLHLPAEIEQRARELSETLGRPAEMSEVFTLVPTRSGSETRLWTYLRSDGTPLVVSLTISSVRSRSGELLGHLGIARDVSAQLQAENDLREANALLETRVGLRTAELSAALAHLRQAQDELLRSEKMAALGSLVAGVAHELNTPLGNCLTTASTLDERTRETLKAFEADKLRRSGLADYLKDADTAASILLRSLGTANELVAHFKQLSVDQTSSQRRQFDLAGTLDDVLSLLRPRLRNTAYTLECRIELQRKLDSYPGPLGQVITNLVLNALIHGFEGREQGRILIKAGELDASHLQLLVEDDGIGMNEDVRRRAFDPFFTTKMGSGGTGLGLNIVYNIVSGVLGGQIELSSAPGQGSRFVMRLPYTAPQLARGVVR